MIQEAVHLLDGLSRQALSLGLTSLWFGVLLALAVYVILRFLPTVSPGAKHNTWWVTLGLIIVAPLVFLIPGVDDLISFQTASAPAPRMVLERPVLTDVAASLRVPIDREFERGVHRDSFRPHTFATSIKPPLRIREQLPVSLPYQPERTTWSMAKSLAPLSVALLTLIIVGVLLARFCWGVVMLFRVKLSAAPVDERTRILAERILQESGIKRPVRLGISDRVRTPVAVGFIQPMIIFPGALPYELYNSELEMIVQHELAHLARWDDCTRVFQRLLEAMLFFHPAVWWITSQIELQREIACDDLVVARTGHRHSYARCLTRLIELTGSSHGRSLAPGALNTGRQIFDRFEAILRGRTDQTGRFTRVASLLTLSVAMVASLAFGAMVPSVQIPEGPFKASALVGELFAPDPPPHALVPARSLQLNNENSFLRAGATFEPMLKLPDKSKLFTVAERNDPAYAAAPEAPSIPGVPSVPSLPSVPSPPSLPSLPANLSYVSVAPVPGGLSYDSDGYVHTHSYTNNGSSYSQIIDDDGRTTYRFSDGRTTIEIEFEGEIEIAASDRDLASLAPRSQFSLLEERGFKDREVVIESDADGQLKYEYYENRRPHDFDDEAREWFGDRLEDAIKRLGFGAESRTRRLYNEGGSAAVFKAVNELETDYAKSSYLSTLSELGRLSSDDFNETFRLLREFDSDFERTQILIALAENQSLEDIPIEEYLYTIESYDSDYERHRALSALTMADKLTPEVLAGILHSASMMDSDYELVEMLIELAPHRTDNPEVNQAFYRAINEVESDYEMRRVISELMYDSKTGDLLLGDVMNLIENMSSDFEKAQLLIELDHRLDAGQRYSTEFIDILASLDSDFEIRRVLESTSIDERTDPDFLIRVLDVADQIDSDYERAELLMSISDGALSHEKTASAYLRVVAALGSDQERGRVLRYFYRRATLTDALLFDALELIDEMDSDYDKSRILRDVHEHYQGNSQLEAAFEDVVDGIDSDYDRNRLRSRIGMQDADDDI